MNEPKPENKNRPSSEEILKSLELCDNGYSSAYECETQMDECKECIYNLLGSDCVLQAIHDALALLREKDARIKELEEAVGAEFTCFVGEPHKVDHCPYGDELARLQKEVAEKDAEIESREKSHIKLYNEMRERLETARADAISEFAERLKERMREVYPADIYDSDIEQIANELKGESK